MDLNIPKTNISKTEKEGLKQLRQNRNIIIKPADKGSATVIMDTENYILEAERQLANPIHYQLLDKPKFPETAQKILEILDKLLNRKFIDMDQYTYLSPPVDPKPRRFYLLPKIHKKRENWTIPDKMPPGRPIISDCGSESYPVSEYIDHFLLPVSTSHPSYLKDTPHFLRTIAQYPIPEDALLITIDVDALYTNINNEDGVRAVAENFKKNPDLSRPTKSILELLKLSLENNDFIFNNRWYLQTFGCAMGKKFSPAYANIFMAEWEEGALAKCPLKPLVYKRFLDDIFIVWTHGLTEFQNFFQTLQTHHESISLKFEVDQEKVNFLDTTIFKGPRFRETGILDTRVYFKETDSLQLLDKNSFHPKHTFNGIIKSQVLRYKRNCNNPGDVDKACKKLFRALGPRGYTQRFLRKIKNDTLHPLGIDNQGHSEKCLNPRCRICLHITPTNEATPAGRNPSAPIPLTTRQTCTDSNGIYYIYCSDCRQGYVGETGNTFKIRLTQHFSDIRTRKDTVVAQHFDPAGDNCNWQSLQITLLETLPINAKDEAYVGKANRLDRERWWIQKLHTSSTQSGLNHIPKPLENPIMPFVLPFSESAGVLAYKTKKVFMKLKAQFPRSFPHKFVTAYSRNQNVRDVLVKSQFGPTPQTPDPMNDSQELLQILAELAEEADDPN